jgi:hypothetical protein
MIAVARMSASDIRVVCVPHIAPLMRATTTVYLNFRI